MWQRHWFAMLILAVFMSGHARQSSAITRTWDDGDPTRLWNADDNWDPTGQPQPFDDAIVGGNPLVTDVEIFNDLTNSGTIDISTGTLSHWGRFKTVVSSTSATGQRSSRR